MTIVAIFLVNAVLSFALSLVVAQLLGPASFGRYALALAIATALNTVLFEWLRLSATRFYSERSRAEAPDIRATLDRGYGVLGGLLVAAAALGAVMGWPHHVSVALVVATGAAGLTLGLYDYRAALARARFLDRTYAILALGRGTGALVLAAGAAWIFAEPGWVLAGSSAAALLAILCVRAPLADTDATGRPRRAIVERFARYAVPLVAASAIYQVLPVVNRMVLADRGGFAEAGYFSLASEIGMRLFQNLGSALDIVLFQVAVRADALHGREVAERQIARNTGLVAALLWPVSVGFWLVMPSFEAVFVPEAFRGHFAPAMGLLIPGLAAFALIQYALNPVFQLRARTGPVVTAALVALVVDLAMVLAQPGLRSPVAFAAAQLAAMGAALLVLGSIALASGARLPWRDLARAGAAALGMAASLWPLLGLRPSLVTLVVQVSTGAIAYAALAIALDVAGSRRLLLRSRRAAASPSPAVGRAP